MVPREEYATVPENATLYEAVLALEKAQEEIDRKKYLYLHRAILVYNENGKIVGKISQLDVLRALEPKYNKIGDTGSLSLTGFSSGFLKSLLEKIPMFSQTLVDISRRADQIRVKDFMYFPTKGEYVSEDTSLESAIHMFVMGHHQSLLVTRGDNIVGILRVTDVFKEVFQRIKIGHTKKDK
jgi:CBS domain-containing protein